MDFDAVEIICTGELDEVIDGERRVFGQEFDRERSLRRGKNCSNTSVLSRNRSTVIGVNVQDLSKLGSARRCVRR
jgi:hypothetical protein